MNRLRFLPLLFCCALLGATIARAQVKPRLQAQEKIQLSFAVKSDVDLYLGFHEINTNTGADYTLPHAGKTQWYKNAPMNFTVTPGVTYEIHMAAGASSWDSTEVHVSAPAGYRTYISAPASGGSTARTTYSAAPMPGVTDHHYAFLTIVPEDGSGTLGVGEFSQPRVRGDFIWSVGLGSTFSRRPVGEIQLRLSDLSAGAFNPAALVFDALTDDVTVTRDGSGVITVINAPQAYVTVSTNLGLGALPGYKLDFGFATIYVQNDAGRLRLTRQQGARTQTWRVTQTGTTVKNWTVEELELSRTCTYASTLLGNGDRQEDVTIADAANVVAQKTRRVYRSFSGTEELIQAIADPDGAALTTTYDYYYGQGDLFTARRGKLKSTTMADGSWTKFDYYGDGSAAEYGRWGQLKAIYKPWQDGPATPDLATLTNCAVTLLDYVGERTVFQENAASSETRILGITTSLSNSNPSFGATANGQPLRTETINTYTGANTYLTNIKKTYHHTAGPDYAGKVYSQTATDGTKVSSYIILGTNYNSEVTVSGWSTAVSGDAVLTTTIAGQMIDPIYLVPNRSTRRTQTTTVGTTSYIDIYSEIFTSTGAWEQIGHTQSRYDGNQHIFDNDVVANVYSVRQWGDGVPTLTTGNDGCVTGMSYDALNRVTSKRRYGVAASGSYPAQGDLYTLYTYDAAGNVLTERTALSSTPAAGDFVTTRTYDLAGRLVTETTPSGLTTSYAYDAANRRTTVTVPGGATQITEGYRDGLSKSVTGTAVAASYQTTTINSDGTLTKTNYALRSTDLAAPTNAPRWARVTSDWAGRTVKEERPAPGPSVFTKLFYYDSFGRPSKTTEPGVAATLTSYNVFGEAYRSGLDVDANGTLDPASLDRITEATTTYLKEYNAWWKVTATRIYNQDNVAAPLPGSVTKQRLTGFTASGQVFQQQETKSIDLFGNVTTQTLIVDRANKLATSTTDVPDSMVDIVGVSYNGLAQSAQSAQGLVSRVYYDAYLRVVKQTDPRTDATPTPRVGFYTAGTGALGQVAWREDSAGNRTNYFYNTTDGRLAYATDPLGKSTRTAYTLRGQPYRTWGDATYPVEYGFNDYGEQTTMNTFRTGTGWTGTTWPASPGTADPTTWSYDPATGLLLSKTDAANKTVAYTYTARGQLATRTWARGVTSTYAYSATTGEQTGISYSDSTPALTYSYNRLGKSVTIGDVTGTRTFAYSPTNLTLQSETLPAYFDGRALAPSYDTTTPGSLGRNTGFTLTGPNATGSDYTVAYGYDSYGRFNTLGAGGTSFTYGFAANTNLIASTSDTSGWTETMSYESNRDLLTSIEGRFASTTKAKFAYTHDALGRRTSVADSGEIFSRYTGGGLSTVYGYNDRSEVISAQSYFGANPADTSQPVAGRGFGYAFDNIGSRTQSSVVGVNSGDVHTTTYSNNALNQVTTRTAPASTEVSGLAPAAASVSLNGSSAGVTRQGDYYYKNVPAGSTPLWQSLTASSSLGGGTTRYAYLAATPESFTYDLDGNVTDDGRWHYTWDAENRLTSMETSLAASTVGTPRQYLSFKYDYLGRRVRKTVSNWNGSAYVAAVDRKFIYNGWNLVAEHDALASNAAVVRYLWGLDISGNLTDGGGVGGLLALFDVASGTTHLPAYDANGNLRALVNRATGAVTAAYEYSAFGETLRATGTYAATNNIRFSTKYTDTETGLLYYGRRYYNATLGRWLGRDPIEEKGGLHLYGFCRNNAINSWDRLGMRDYLSRGDATPEVQARLKYQGQNNLPGSINQYEVYYVDPETGIKYIDFFEGDDDGWTLQGAQLEAFVASEQGREAASQQNAEAASHEGFITPHPPVTLATLGLDKVTANTSARLTTGLQTSLTTGFAATSDASYTNATSTSSGRVDTTLTNGNNGATTLILSTSAASISTPTTAHPSSGASTNTTADPTRGSNVAGAGNSGATSSNSIGVFTATQMRPGDVVVYIDNNIVQSAVGALTPGTAGHVAVALNHGTVLTDRPGDGVTIDRTPYGGGSGSNLVVLRPDAPVNTIALIQYATSVVGENPGYSYVMGPINAVLGVTERSQPVCATVVSSGLTAAGVRLPEGTTTPGDFQRAPGFHQVWPAPAPVPRGPKGPG